MTGQSDGGSTSTDYATIAYDALTGTQLWVARYDGPGHLPDSPFAIAVSPDGSTVAVTGQSTGTGFGLDYATVAYAAASGTQLWAATYDGLGHGADQATGITFGPNGTIYVLGTSQGLSSGTDILTVAYNPVDGIQLWAVRFTGAGNDSAGPYSAIHTSPDGSRVFVTGSSFGMGTAYDFVTIAYDTTNGARLWAVVYNSPTGGFEYPSSLAVLPDGSSVVVTGSSSPRGTTLNDNVTVAYRASDGVQQWVKTYDGPSHGDDVGNSIAVSPDSGTVVVTGWSNNDGTNAVVGRDVVTVAYSAATGQVRWGVRFDGPGHGQDDGSCVVLSTSGAVAYVTGESTGKGATLDYQTFAYRM